MKKPIFYSNFINIQNSPGLNKSYDKNSSTGGGVNSKVQLLGINNAKIASASNNNNMAGQRQSQNQLTFGSPDKTNVKNAARRGS